MKYVFIEKHQAEFSIKAMCRVLRVARSGWYTWCQRRTRISTRQQFRQHCDSVVLAAFTRSKQRYGAPRLTDELRAQGYPFNVKTVAASLRRQGLRAKASRKFSPVSYRAHGLPVSENLLEQDFYASGPNQKWAGDITYLRTDEGWLYLAVVIDLWSRAVIGFFTIILSSLRILIVADESCSEEPPQTKVWIRYLCAPSHDSLGTTGQVP